MSKVIDWYDIEAAENEVFFRKEDWLRSKG